MTQPRTIPVLLVRRSTEPGADPDAFDAINDAPLIDFGEYPPCPDNPHGTGCHFSDPWNENAPCIYCGKPGGQ